MTERDYEQFKVNTINEMQGSLNEKDDYSCELCRNKGFFAELRELPNGRYTQIMVDCKCMKIRRTLNRMRQSGLKNVIRNYTFDRYEASEEWQKLLKEKATMYSKNPQGWFFSAVSPVSVKVTFAPRFAESSC